VLAWVSQLMSFCDILDSVWVCYCNVFDKARQFLLSWFDQVFFPLKLTMILPSISPLNLILGHLWLQKLQQNTITVTKVTEPMDLLPDLNPKNNVDCTKRTFISIIVSSSSMSFRDHTQYFHTNCAITTNHNARPSPIIPRNSPSKNIYIYSPCFSRP